MQGQSDSQRSLFDAEALCGHLIPKGSVYRFLADHREELFCPQMFSDLYSSGVGRPSVPPERVATAIVLQSLEGLSDREAAERLTRDVAWKLATGVPLTEPGFHPTVFTYSRRRLQASEDPQRIFEAVRK
ncbi:MAG: transposase, partial [Acidimicrobiia bacterium]